MPQYVFTALFNPSQGQDVDSVLSDVVREVDVLTEVVRFKVMAVGVGTNTQMIAITYRGLNANEARRTGAHAAWALSRVASADTFEVTGGRGYAEDARAVTPKQVDQATIDRLVESRSR